MSESIFFSLFLSTFFFFFFQISSKVTAMNNHFIMPIQSGSSSWVSACVWVCVATDLLRYTVMIDETLELIVCFRWYLTFWFIYLSENACHIVQIIRICTHHLNVLHLLFVPLCHCAHANLPIIWCVCCVFCFFSVFWLYSALFCVSASLIMVYPATVIDHAEEEKKTEVFEIDHKQWDRTAIVSRIIGRNDTLQCIRSNWMRNKYHHLSGWWSVRPRTKLQ